MEECIPVGPSCGCIPCAPPEICSPHLRFIHQGLKNMQSQKWRRSFAHDRLRRTSRCRIMVKSSRRSRATALQRPPSMQRGLKNNIEKMPPRRDCINAFTRHAYPPRLGFMGTLGCCWAGPGCWAKLFLASRLTGCVTFVLKRYSYTPLFVSEFSFLSLKLKNQFPNEVRVPKIYFIRRCIQNE